MKTWSEIDNNNNVINTIVSSESFVDSLPGIFIECTESTGLGSIGMTYNKEKNKFIHAKPFISWILDEETLEWNSPVGDKPNDGKLYMWDESSQNWVELLRLDIEL